MAKKSEHALVRIADAQNAELRSLKFSSPVAHVYYPQEYARSTFVQYAERFGSAPKEAIFVGMNPGPFGMGQTGIPFGEVSMVRDWMKLDGSKIGHADDEHPKRPVEGFACKRAEVSGARLWGLAKARFETPEKFFADFFVWNYCPMLFLSETGSNVTPDKLPAAKRHAIDVICDRALFEVVKTLKPKFVVGVGAYAEERAARVFENYPVKIGRIAHPSPASPVANRGWNALAESAIHTLGIKWPAG